MAGKEDEVIISEEATEPVDIELEAEPSEEGDGAQVTDDATAKADAAPKAEAAKKDTGEETDEQKRERRRQERQERKERQRRGREELEQLRVESAQLKREVQELRSKTQTSETASALQKAQADMQVVEAVIAKAVEDGNGVKHVEALRVRDAIQHRINVLQSGQQQKPQTQQPQRQQMNPAVQTHAQKFLQEHTWYQAAADTPDLDSQIVKTIDRAITAEGYDPASEDYWDELRERIAEKLPHRRAAAVTQQPQAAAPAAAKGGPQVGSGRSQVLPGRQQFTLTREHLNAIAAAGKDISDPAVLKHYAKLYRDSERQNAQA